MTAAPALPTGFRKMSAVSARLCRKNMKGAAGAAAYILENN